MAILPLTLHVDSKTAEAYASASEEARKKIELLLSLRLRELISFEGPSLREIMDEMGREAESRGLTPEILESVWSEGPS